MLKTEKRDDESPGAAAVRAHAASLFAAARSLSADGEGVTREAFGERESAVLDCIEAAGRALGLAPHRDPAGNLWLRREGEEPSLPLIVLGSHADSVPQGGNFDGLVGIAAGLAALERLAAEGIALRHPCAVLALRGEENSFYGKPYIGSRMLLGQFPRAELELRHRTTGRTLGEAVAAAGVDPEAVSAGRFLVDPKSLRCFIELHIEQGPTLDLSPDVRVGVVTGIRAIASHKTVVCRPLREGADPAAATASLLCRMEDHWEEALARGEDLVETTGILETRSASADAGAEAGERALPDSSPLAPASSAAFSFDIRSLHRSTIERFHALLLEEAAAAGSARGAAFDFDPMLYSPAAVMDPALRRFLHEGAEAADVPVRDMSSGAGHDSAVFAAAGVPTAMLFIANRFGSHNPHEAMDMADFLAGTAVLAEALKRLDKAPDV